MKRSPGARSHALLRNLEDIMQKAYWKSLLMTAVLALLWFGAGLAKAQDDTAKKTETTESPAPEQRKPEVHVYRLDYKMYELDDGKRTNSRSYTLLARSSKSPIDRAHLRTGNRVPIRRSGASSNNMQVIPGDIEYEDVGMNIDSSVEEQSNKILVGTVLAMSSVVPNEPGAANPTGNPVFRTLRLEDVTLAIPGKPTLVGAIDDVTANRRYEIEVTVTKID